MLTIATRKICISRNMLTIATICNESPHSYYIHFASPSLGRQILSPIICWRCSPSIVIVTHTYLLIGVTEGTLVFVLNMLGPADMQQRELDDMQDQLDELLMDPVHVRFLFYIPVIQNLFDQSNHTAMWVCYLLITGIREIAYVDLKPIHNNPATLQIILNAAHNISTMQKMMDATLVRTKPRNKALPSRHHDPPFSTLNQDPLVPKPIEDMSRNMTNNRNQIKQTNSLSLVQTDGKRVHITSYKINPQTKACNVDQSLQQQSRSC